MKQTIRLTESELRDYINNAVCEALEDEGFFGGLGSLASKVGNKFGQGFNKAGSALGGAFNKGKEAVGNAYNNAKQQVGNAYNNAKQQVGNAYQNAKKTYQMGSINQDAQNAISKAVEALNNLKALNQKSLQYSNVAPINKKAMANIENTIASLQNSGATGVSGGFKANKTAFSK